MLLLQQAGSGTLNAARMCPLSPVWWECHSLMEMRAGIPVDPWMGFSQRQWESKTRRNTRYCGMGNRDKAW